MSNTFYSAKPATSSVKHSTNLNKIYNKDLEGVIENPPIKK